ncbi:SDR family oxidoreductase [Photobacterium sp. DNB23_23_1]
MDLGLKNRKAIVIGAARGLGAAIAKSLLAEGVEVIAFVRDTEVLLQAHTHLPEEQKQRLHPVSMDLSDIESVKAAVLKAQELGGADILVGNCGGPPPCAAEEAIHADWLKHFEAMAANLFWLTQSCLPKMKEQGWGRIAYITSSGVEQPIPRLALSNSIRSAVVGWSKSLANEVAKNGVTVNCVLPGRIHTHRVDQLDQAAATRQGKSLDEVALASKASIPAERYGTPQEFADVVTFLVSERASYVTGGKIRVDGGAIRSI